MLSKEQGAVEPSASNAHAAARDRREAERAIAAGAAVPEGVRSIGTLILTILAIVYTLYFGKEVLLPLALAIILKLLLGPAMRLLHERVHLPTRSPPFC